MLCFEKSSSLPVSARQAFAWHVRPGAFQRLTPPWVRTKIVQPAPGIVDGSRLIFKVLQGPVAIRWVAEHHSVLPDRQFCDRQIAGPFASWDHRHELEPKGDRAILHDRIRYALPLGRLGAAVGASKVHRDLERMFAYRHRITIGDLQLHESYRAAPRLKVAVSGAHGLIGSALCALLTTGGHQVIRVVTGKAAAGDEAVWNAQLGLEPRERLERLDAFVDLAGHRLATPVAREARGADVMEARVDRLYRLIKALEGLHEPPRAFLNLSSLHAARPSTGEHEISEHFSEHFSERSARRWESAAEQASVFAVRVVHLRLGEVLSPEAGRLERWSSPWRLRMDVQQRPIEPVVDWISIDDAISSILHILYHPQMCGPVHLTAPTATTRHEITEMSREVLGRSSWVRLPAWLPRKRKSAGRGSARRAQVSVTPDELLEHGYAFRYPRLEEALLHLFGACDAKLIEATRQRARGTEIG